MFLSKHGEKKGWLGGGVQNTIKVTGLGTLLPALNNISVKTYFLKQSDTIETRKMASCAIHCLVNNYVIYQQTINFNRDTKNGILCK